MKILVTGATGFVGKHLFQYFSQNHDVYGTSRSPSINDKIFTLDLRSDITNDLINIGFDIIVHSASVLATESNSKDFNLFWDNIQITRSMVAFIKKTKPKMFFNLSTIGVYPNITGTYREDSLIMPSMNFEGLYGLAKFGSEEIFSFYTKGLSTILVNLRLGQIIGEGMRDDRIYTIMKNELSRDNRISVYGAGKRTSAFMSVEYLCEVISELINSKIDITGTYNLAQENITYLNLARRIIMKFGDSESHISYKTVDREEVVNIDCRKINKLLNG